MTCAHPRERLTTVVVIGAGQAGLACSYYLSRFGVDHVVLERGEVANSWRHERWDSLRLLTPNWQNGLPGQAYQGDDPDGFMDMRGVIDLITSYGRHHQAPVQVHTRVTGVAPAPGGYRVCTDRGNWRCVSIIVASGAFNLPSIPALAHELPASVAQFSSHDYRNPGQLPGGDVLVVGAAASGVQIADEIQRSGHPVTLAVGEHVRMPRTYRGRDIQYWLQATGLLDENWRQLEDLSRARRLPSPQLLGSPERREADLNRLQQQGVRLAGRLAGIHAGKLQFSGGLANVTRLADLKLGRLLDGIDSWIEVNTPQVAPVRRPASIQLDNLAGLGLPLGKGGIQTVIWATGYRPDYSWLELPIFDRRGMPQHEGGVSAMPGVYFMGLPFMRRRRSSFICGAGDDARDICHHLLAYIGRPVDWYWCRRSA
ncbi:pyridine nucleotide-disulfide oxidoreductase [Seongchinamella unica]|uniref:Pyridine nucleotide-disulfide oxidoreductase n=1 Tax=Seongchinamella unica TaxID=2547392 RepID=A0A4R5LVG0_9GAMM|nr:NAD(P)-binding domain-containing protein [Seongchinamella unica]TDG15390.1 pyridine nucleotide-disulfide oxidoreductase [Seongchinamella unica]